MTSSPKARAPFNTIDMCDSDEVRDAAEKLRYTHPELGYAEIKNVARELDYDVPTISRALQVVSRERNKLRLAMHQRRKRTLEERRRLAKRLGAALFGIGLTALVLFSMHMSVRRHLRGSLAEVEARRDRAIAAINAPGERQSYDDAAMAYNRDANGLIHCLVAKLSGLPERVPLSNEAKSPAP